MNDSINSPQQCPLCGSDNTVLIPNTGKQIYFSCNICGLTSLSQKQLLKPDEEQFRYEQHNNNPDDPRYREFLGKLYIPLQSLLKKSSFGLDFGCGPGPALALMFEDSGYRMNTYDPYFANNPAALNKYYDFITSTEVFEHFYNPFKDIDLLFSLLKPQGILGVMTKLLKDDIDFPTWFYRNDTTHVTFYTKKTWEWISRRWNATILTLDDNIVIFRTA
jgi:Methyltransferase domain